MNVSRRTWLGVLVLGLAICWLGSAAQADDKKGGNVTGTWKSSFTRNDGQTIETTYKFKQEGEKLTGTAKRGEGEERKIEEGKVKDGKVSFQYTVEANGNKITVKYSGELNGDSIKGKVEVNDRSFDWEAKRQKKEK